MGGGLMHVGELLYRIAEQGVTLRCGRTEDRLSYSPAGALPPGLVAEIKEHKAEIIALMREDERCREDRRLEETGVIQCEWQVFEMVRARFGSNRQEKE